MLALTLSPLSLSSPVAEARAGTVNMMARKAIGAKDELIELAEAQNIPMGFCTHSKLNQARRATSAQLEVTGSPFRATHARANAS